LTYSMEEFFCIFQRRDNSSQSRSSENAKGFA